MKEMKTLKFPNQDEPYEIVDAKAREMASVQPDWSVNDESNPAFIKNRPSGLPEVAASDNGKFLRVVDGAWSAATIANAEEASF
jgi:hypothetical protein